MVCKRGINIFAQLSLEFPYLKEVESLYYAAALCQYCVWSQMYDKLIKISGIKMFNEYFLKELGFFLKKNSK